MRLRSELGPHPAPLLPGLHRPRRGPRAGALPAAPDADPATGVAASSPPAGGEVAADVKDPSKKPRGWRKNRSGAAEDVATGMAVGAAAGMAAQPAAPSFFAPMEPPAEPPSDPVPLKLAGTLPPPPADDLAPPLKRGSVAWKPPIDPATGQPAWDQSPVPAEGPPKKRKSWRKAKEGAVVAAGATGAVAVADAAGLDAGVPGPPARHRVQPSGAAADSKPKSNRTLVTVLVVVLLVVIGGVAYFAVKRNSNTTPTTAATAPVAPRAAADVALATSINLRLTDLPNGWSRSPSTVKTLVPVPPAAAQVQADRGLSSCLSQPYGLVAGLFGHAPSPVRRPRPAPRRSRTGPMRICRWLPRQP